MDQGVRLELERQYLEDLLSLISPCLDFSLHFGFLSSTE